MTFTHESKPALVAGVSALMRALGAAALALIALIALLALLALLVLPGCSSDGAGESSGSSADQGENALSEEAATSVDLSKIDWSYTDRDLDPSYDESTAVKIAFADGSASIEGEGASASEDGRTVTVSQGGTYVVSGTSSDAQIVIDAADDQKIQLVLAGVQLTCADGPAIFAKSADKLFITLAQGSDNSLADGETHSTVADDDGTDNDLDGVVYSRADLVFNGSGSLSVSASYDHGIVSKDDLKICGGSYSVSAVGDALQGKDCVMIHDGSVSLVAGGDGIDSSNGEDEDKGYVLIDGGSVTIEADDDAVQACNVVRMTGGEVSATCAGGAGEASASTAQDGGFAFGGDPFAGGADQAESLNGADSAASTDETASAKGIVSDSGVSIEGGELSIDSADDAVHCNAAIEISGGTCSLKSGDDGVHADTSLSISGGSVGVEQSYEGLEAANITISGGDIRITASDDGLNAAGGADSSAEMGPVNDQFSTSTDTGYYINVYGGYMWVEASGDGIDSNGDLYVTGGVTIVNCGAAGGESAIDWQTECAVDGGTIVGVGPSGMDESFGSNSQQGCLRVTQGFEAGESIAVCNDGGEVVFSFAPTVSATSLVCSAPGIETGGSYTVVTGGAVSGGEAVGDDGYAEGGAVSGGSSATATATTGGGFSAGEGGMGNTFGGGEPMQGDIPGGMGGGGMGGGMGGGGMGGGMGGGGSMP